MTWYLSELHVRLKWFQWEQPAAAAAAAKSLQLCPTLCDPIDSSPPGSPVPGILQARTLEWVAISFSNAWKWKVKVKSLSHVWLLATPWTAAYQAPPSMGFSRQEYWSGVPLPSPSHLILVSNFLSQSLLMYYQIRSFFYYSIWLLKLISFDSQLLEIMQLMNLLYLPPSFPFSAQLL